MTNSLRRCVLEKVKVDLKVVKCVSETKMDLTSSEPMKPRMMSMECKDYRKKHLHFHY